ncbi:unnamed protein product [Lactuca virosa]|uniref:Gibberellin regulated protein n=1 Tax=Lactuca virosa TaxID=75947 RepID=A0AAU9MKJ0_9ASTR|nr:unnamed protein product [Lactuca virosa]
MTVSKGLTSHVTCLTSPTAAHYSLLRHYKYSSSPPPFLTNKHLKESVLHSYNFKKNMKLQSATTSLILLLLLALLFISSLVESTTTITTSPTAAPVPSPSGSFGCDKKCELRCSRSGWRKMCLKLCGICCGKCKGCVPSGPYADKAQCPCYRDMKNQKGRDKCP